MEDKPDSLGAGYHSIIGIDYGPVNSDRSNTVVVVMQERAGEFRVVYMKKFRNTWI